ncbi:hypothetical protein [Streptomyces megasporus]|uniref:hypothetical protein n=1 Tax=Streptomyces megasporus TaxID=44060 RepID=UPI0004E1AAA8|nr:hypothetical protein [Streptomyces megasporus]
MTTSMPTPRQVTLTGVLPDSASIEVHDDGTCTFLLRHTLLGQTGDAATVTVPCHVGTPEATGDLRATEPGTRITVTGYLTPPRPAGRATLSVETLLIGDVPPQQRLEPQEPQSVRRYGPYLLIDTRHPDGRTVTHITTGTGLYVGSGHNSDTVTAAITGWERRTR